MLTGARRDPYDPRDYWLASAAYPLPEGDVEIPVTRPVRQQLGGSCVAHAWVAALEVQADALGVYCPDLSAHYLYALARWVATGGATWDLADHGTWPRSAAAALRWYGCPPASVYPEDPRTLSGLPSAPGWYARAAGADWRVEVGGVHYHRASGPLDVDRALGAGLPVVAAAPVGARWVDWSRGDAPLGPVEGDETSLGGHAVLIVGKRGKSYRIRNSWGSSWGDGGYAMVSRQWIESSGLHWVDLWTGSLAWRKL